MSGPKWFYNASKYGHCDFFDPTYRDIATAMCASCQRNCEFGQYRTFVKELILSFSDAILNKDSLALKYIQEGKFSIPSEHHFDHMGYDPLKGGFCDRVKKRVDDENKVEDNNLSES